MQHFNFENQWQWKKKDFFKNIVKRIREFRHVEELLQPHQMQLLWVWLQGSLFAQEMIIYIFLFSAEPWWLSSFVPKHFKLLFKDAQKQWENFFIFPQDEDDWLTSKKSIAWECRQGKKPVRYFLNDSFVRFILRLFLIHHRCSLNNKKRNLQLNSWWILHTH